MLCKHMEHGTPMPDAFTISLLVALSINALVYAASKLWIHTDSRLPFAGTAVGAVFGMLTAAMLSNNLCTISKLISIMVGLWLIYILKCAICGGKSGKTEISTRSMETKHGLGLPALVPWASETAVIFFLCLPVWYIISAGDLCSKNTLAAWEIGAGLGLCGLMLALICYKGKENKHASSPNNCLIFKSRNITNALLSNSVPINLWMVIQYMSIGPIIKHNFINPTLHRTLFIFIALIPSAVVSSVSCIACSKLSNKLKKSPSLSQKPGAKTKRLNPALPKTQKSKSASKTIIPKSKNKHSTIKQPLSVSSDKKVSAAKTRISDKQYTSGPADSVKRSPRRKSVTS